ncbi:Gibberellin 2-beta-dioxygenase 8 [Bienertia sinuspersici]
MSKSNIESYPPMFRPSSADPTRQPDLNDSESSGAGISDLPLIDMMCLDIEKLDKACREWGIFRLENHGVPTVVLSQLQEHAKRIFKLSFEAKQSLVNSNCPIKYFWGTPALTSSGIALPRATNDALNMDWVEGLNVPFSQLKYDHHHHHNLLINDFSNGEQAKGLHEHTDSSILSILSEDQVGGLRFFKDEQWFKVKPNPTTLVVNLGDMMQVISDDEYKSVKHKVELNKEKERVSICYFVFPEENTLIHSSHFKPFTYNDFRAQVQLDLKTHGSKIGLVNFKLQHCQDHFA